MLTCKTVLLVAFLVQVFPLVSIAQETRAEPSDRNVTSPATPLEIWNKLDFLSKAFYLQGLLGGIALGTLESPSGQRAEEKRAFLRCAVPGAGGRSTGPQSLSTEQSIAIIDKYVKDKPEDWSKPMFLMVFSVLYTTCKAANP